ncbi:MAG: dephospho-CoA kinase, partial [Bacteroidota bacterium]
MNSLLVHRMVQAKKPLPRNKPVRVCLTGGIVSGKSTVGMIFKSLDVPIFDSDFEAKRILSS